MCSDDLGRMPGQLLTSSPSSALLQRLHPVAYGHALARAPLSATLLERPIVLWRDLNGVPHALQDLCIHRGTALSLGTTAGDEIVCPYHGWHFAADGQCTLIPQIEKGCGIPRRARVPSFTCIERYGIVWVGLEEPRYPLPDIPELEQSQWRVVATGPFAWRSDASRQVENFTDFGHFSFVHPGLLGDPLRPQVPNHEVRTDDQVLHYEIVRPEAPNSSDFPVFANFALNKPERRSRYELHLPYTIVLRLGWGGEAGMVYFFTSQPVSMDRCIGYCLIARNYNLDQEDRVLREFEDVIFAQDQRVVESQRPEQVPFDIAAELHLRFDAVAVAYRRAMKAHGLLWNAVC